MRKLYLLQACHSFHFHGHYAGPVFHEVEFAGVSAFLIRAVSSVLGSVLKGGLGDYVVNAFVVIDCCALQ